MTTSLDTRIRRALGMLVALAVISLISAASGLADGRPAASYYTKQQLQAMSERWAAKAAHDSQATLVGHPAASYYTKQQLEAMSQSWAARAALSSLATAEAALGSLPFQARSALLSRVGQTPVVVSSHSSFEWGDFGIGAAGMLGLVLLAGGAFFVVRFGRRSTSLPVHRPV
jgi:hypothetical protein